MTIWYTHIKQQKNKYEITNAEQRPLRGQRNGTDAAMIGSEGVNSVKQHSKPFKCLPMGEGSN